MEQRERETRQELKSKLSLERLYSQVKAEPSLEGYTAWSMADRSLLAKWRGGLCGLRIDTSSRARKTERESMQCETCGVVEDERHFFEDCELTRECRDELRKDMAGESNLSSSLVGTVGGTSEEQGRRESVGRHTQTLGRGGSGTLLEGGATSGVTPVRERGGLNPAAALLRGGDTLADLTRLRRTLRFIRKGMKNRDETIELDTE